MSSTSVLFKAMLCLLLLYYHLCQGFLPANNIKGKPLNFSLKCTTRPFMSRSNKIQQVRVICARKRHNSYSREKIILMSSTGVISITNTFAKTSLSNIHTLTGTLSSTPPLFYFLALMLAGVGFPISEDALCIFVGMILNSKSNEIRLKLVISLYLGVILSDALTFWIGRMLSVGLFAPLRDRLAILQQQDDRQKVMDIPSDDGRHKKGGKRDVIRRKIRAAGDYIGLITRLSIGARGPIMLLTGFLGKVSFLKFFAGVCGGGVISLLLQLSLGYSLRNNPNVLVAIVGGTAVSVVAVIGVGCFIWLWNIFRGRMQAKLSR